MDKNLLSLILFTPIAGLLVLLLIPSRNKDLIRLWANLVAFGGFLISLPLVSRFDKNAVGFQFMERADWIPSLGAQYLIGIDGISRETLALRRSCPQLAVRISRTVAPKLLTQR